MENGEILIIKPHIPLGERDMEYTRKLIMQQKDEGVVMLPFGYEVIVKPRNVQIELGPDKDEDKIIHNAVTYICMADRNNRGAEADQIAQLLYNRAYSKGLKAGRLEGNNTHVVTKVIHEVVDPNEDWGDFKG